MSTAYVAKSISDSKWVYFCLKAAEGEIKHIRRTHKSQRFLILIFAGNDAH